MANAQIHQITKLKRHSKSIIIPYLSQSMESMTWVLVLVVDIVLRTVRKYIYLYIKRGREIEFAIVAQNGRAQINLLTHSFEFKSNYFNVYPTEWHVCRHGRRGRKCVFVRKRKIKSYTCECVFGNIFIEMADRRACQGAHNHQHDCVQKSFYTYGIYIWSYECLTSTTHIIQSTKEYIKQ